MHIKEKLLLIIVFGAFISGLTSFQVEGYGNNANNGKYGIKDMTNGEHAGLTNAALVVKKGIHGSNSKFWSEAGDSENYDSILRGARNEDEENNKLNCLQHFYTPSNCPDDTGEYAGMSAGLFGTLVPANYRAKVLYKQAITYYQRGDKEKAYEMLGHVIHLTQDMTVPAHTKKEKTVCITPYHF